MDTIWFRIESELEGEGVEKSDIEINKGYIHSWIQTALASGNLDKTASADAASDQDIHRNRWIPRRTTESITRSWIEAISLRIDSLNPKSSDAMQSPTIASSVMENSSPIWLPSGSSHRSQASTWYLTSRPNNKYVCQRLLQLAIPDVKLLLDYESRQDLIKSAFFQIDWKEETNILRQEAFDIWASVTEEVNIKLKPGRLIGIVRSGDRNKDGVIDLKEFIKISENIVDEIEKSHDEKLEDMIVGAGSEAFQNEAAALRESHLANPSQAPIPWGWTYVTPDAFREMISGYETRKLPEIDQHSFSCMAYSTAPRCLARIHRFIDDYRLLTIADNSTRDMAILDALDTIKKAALKFVKLENQTKPEAWFSDLDYMVSECRIVHNVEPHHFLLEDCPVESMATITSAYQILLGQILGFLRAMDQAYNLNRAYISANQTPTFRIAFGPAWLTMRMETRARLVSAQLAVWDEVEEAVKKCRSWAETKPDLAEKAITLAKAENKAAKDRLRATHEEIRRISEILEDKQPLVRFKITSARGLPKTKWATFTYLPNPFAVLYEGGSKKSETGLVLKNVDPDWQHPWTSFKLCSAESKSPSTPPIISVFDGVSEEKRTDPKYLIGKTDCISVDGHRSSDSSPWKVPELSFKGHSLLEPFSGKHNPTSNNFPAMQLTIVKGDVQLDLVHPSQGTITALMEWEGLSNLVRKEKLQLKEFLEANPNCRPLFPEEREQFAAPDALTAVQVISDDRYTKQVPLLAFLMLPKDWRLRGVPKAYYIGFEVFEDDDEIGLTPGGHLPSYIERRFQKNGRVYFVNHKAQTTSWEDPRLSK